MSLSSCPTIRNGKVCGGILKVYHKKSKNMSGDVTKTTTYFRCRKSGCQSYHSPKKVMIDNSLGTVLEGSFIKSIFPSSNVELKTKCSHLRKGKCAYLKKKLLLECDNIYKFSNIGIDHMKNNKRKKIKKTVSVHNMSELQSTSNENTTSWVIQDSNCFSLTADIHCCECREYNTTGSTEPYDNIQCRFYAFRKLEIKSGQLVVAGFLDPYEDVKEPDTLLWAPVKYQSAYTDLDIGASIKILEDVGGQLCKVIEDEKEALRLSLSLNKNKPIWKKPVRGAREICDVCKTSIFNYHWSCLKCGFVICVDCVRDNIQKNTPDTENLLVLEGIHCYNFDIHRLDQLNITQILPGDSLDSISKLLHDVCAKRKISLKCDCKQPLLPTNTPVNMPPEGGRIELIKQFNVTFSIDKSLNVYAIKSPDTVSSNIGEPLFNLHNLNINPPHGSSNIGEPLFNLFNLNINTPHASSNTREPLYNLSTMFETNDTPPHVWMMHNQKILHLLDPGTNSNYELFQEQWRRGDPVVVSGMNKYLTKSLWHPESFNKDFGDDLHDLIDSSTGTVLHNQPMSIFWEGFQNSSRRIVNHFGEPMMLKLKDWPQSEDFAKQLPNRFKNLMDSLPLKQYTQREGKFNLVSYLPEFFVPPDMGPKMYIAYGNASSVHKAHGTTNLHLDMADAVNVIVHVATTEDDNIEKVFKVIDEGGGCIQSEKIRYEKGEIPGALWHIFHAKDAPTIRQMLHKLEKGVPTIDNSDPIHDQSHYLTAKHRSILLKDYGVKCYSIVQYEGDALFVPSGAPHQVRNLHNCIKVAEDFVSPENIHHTYHMTQEFRNLSDDHNNHEDKLQLKNILFHAVKESITILQSVQ